MTWLQLTAVAVSPVGVGGIPLDAIVVVVVDFATVVVVVPQAGVVAATHGLAVDCPALFSAATS